MRRCLTGALAEFYRGASVSGSNGRASAPCAIAAAARCEVVFEVVGRRHHTQEVLQDLLGVSAKQMAALKAKKIV